MVPGQFGVGFKTSHSSDDGYTRVFFLTLWESYSVARGYSHEENTNSEGSASGLKFIQTVPREASLVSRDPVLIGPSATWSYMCTRVRYPGLTAG